MDKAFREGRTAFPDIELAPSLFNEFARARIENIDSWSANPERAADLYLAAACVARVPAAIAEFVARFGDRIPKYLGRLTRNADVVAEVRQIVATRCIVGDADHAPALNSYSGAGSLEGWIRATAVREALALTRATRRQTDNVEAALEAQVPWVDREISLFKQIYREPVSRAFAAACAQLSADDRALLRLHYAQGVTTASLATMYGLSRATLTRRLADARDALARRVKSELRASSGVADNDFESVVKLLQSQLDLRLSMVLKEPEHRN